MDGKEEVEGEVIVIDLGTGFIKAGWAGEDHPRFVIPAVVTDNHGQALPAHNAEAEAEYLVGHEALQALHNTNQPATYPIERGQVVDWEALNKIWDHIFKNCLRVTPSEETVLITVPPLCSKKMQEEIARQMFKVHHVAALCMCNASVLSLFSTGRTTGVVLEVGEGVTYTVPVFEGYSLSHATLKLPLAGKDVTKRLMSILSEKGIVFSDNHVDIVRDIKEKLCALKLDEDAEPQEVNPDDMTYELPDGQIITIDEIARHESPEILINPDNVEPTTEEDFTAGVAKMIFKSISMCDNELQKDLYKNIVLAGGSSMLPGFGERMRREMANLVQQERERPNTSLIDQYEYTSMILDSQRKNSAWIGGSMFASLETFGLIKISQQDYQADEDIIFKKFFG